MKGKRKIATCMALSMSCILAISTISQAFKASATGLDDSLESSTGISEDFSSSSLPDIGSDPGVLNNVNSIFENTNDPNSENNYNPIYNTPDLQDPTSLTDLDEANYLDLLRASGVDGFLTPQDYGAVANDGNPDTEAFRKLFKAAYDSSINKSTLGYAWAHTKPIFIPAGEYIIDGSLIDYTSDMRLAMFEVFGAGRESTRIKFTSTGTLFDDQVPESSKGKISDNNYKKPIFGFTTFRNIEFVGNNNNTFLTMRDARKYEQNASGQMVNIAANDGPQRMQFISCGFSNWHTIINTVHSSCQLSEVTFAYCKIADCGAKDNPCRMFSLDCSQAVNWRFNFTDIESFNGDCFYFKEAASVQIVGGSIIANNGNAFFFDFTSSESCDHSGESNSPHLYCDGSHFEIRHDPTNGWDSTLLKTTSIMAGTPNVVFRSCKMGTGSNHSPHYLEIYGGGDILFDNCYDLKNMSITANVSTSSVINPRLKFVNCSDIDADKLAVNSTSKDTFQNPATEKYTNAGTDQGLSNVHIMIDDSYDFYLRRYRSDSNPNDPRAPYLHTINGLNECRQHVKLQVVNTLNLEYLSYTSLNNGLSFKTKPYGFVKYIELTTTPWNSVGGNVTLTLYDNGAVGGRKQLGDPIVLPIGETHTHIIYINDYVEDLEGIFTHSLSSTPQTCMSMDIVKY